MKSKKWLPLIFLLVIPLAFASEQNLVYDSTPNIVKIGYDSLNRITSKNSSSEIINYSYDIQFQGTLANISFGNSTYKYTYDDKLRVIEEKRIIDGIEFSKKYIYDSNDRLRSIIFSTGQDFDFYYNPQSKVNKIIGYVNDTEYNALGNPLNRTYFNSKITTFDYQSNNLRLRQIKTDTIQNLNYSYDSVGNIVSINDSVNNRTYSMSYDNLDRLTNVSIGSYKWVYSYNAIGNMLKTVRNFSTTTSFKYDGSLAHAPQRYMVSNTSVDVYRPSVYNTTNRTQIAQFYVINEKNSSLINLSWSASFGDEISVNSSNFSLDVNSYLLVSVEHNYSRGGNYFVNITGKANETLSDYETLDLIFGAVTRGLSILKKNATNVITEFTAENTISQLSTDWSWNCSNGIGSNIAFNMSANQNLLVVLENNYTLKDIVNLTCSVNSTDGNQSKLLQFAFDGIKIENFNSTKLDLDTVVVRFDVKNYFSTLNISWNITADNMIYNGTISDLNQLQSTTISQEINFTKGGLKYIKVQIGSGNFTDSYSEYYKINWLNINQFFGTLKNATARVYDFLITNFNSINTTTLWNFTNPTLNNSLNLSNNESLIVVIEEDYSQGNKQATMQVFNQTIVEDNLIEVFRIRQIQINSFQTLFENTSKAVISSFVKNNINPLNVSWKLDNSESLINSTQNLQLNTSEQVIVVIESNFSSSGIYPLQFVVNSSSFNDNATGVAVS